MDKRVIFMFLVINFVNVLSSPRFVDFVNKKDVFCGSKLTDALALICKGNYNSPSKKSTGNDVLTIYDDIYDDDIQDLPLFNPKDLANSFLPARFRRRGIVDECCWNPCTFKHLSLYCAPSDS